MNAPPVCGEGRVRGFMAAEVAPEWPGAASGSAGVGRDADERLGRDQVDWADRIFVVERRHRARLARLPSLVASGRRVVRLGVPDRFARGDPAPAAPLRRRLARLLA